jgi:hypothetical protein
MNQRDDIDLTSLSIGDFDDIVLSLRIRSFQGEPTAGAVADAIESVAERRHARRLADERMATGKFVSSTWRLVTAWASTKQ